MPYVAAVVATLVGYEQELGQDLHGCMSEPRACCMALCKCHNQQTKRASHQHTTVTANCAAGMPTLMLTVTVT
jgi:hypothetical protein